MDIRHIHGLDQVVMQRLLLQLQLQLQMPRHHRARVGILLEYSSNACRIFGYDLSRNGVLWKLWGD